MQFSNVEKLEEFVAEVDEYLTTTDNIKTVLYVSKYSVPWNSEKLKEDNEELLSSISGAANIYVIYTTDKNSKERVLRYVGKTKRNLARQRLTNHLIKKHKKTGAKLNRVIDHIQSGGSIEIAWVTIEPESLRNYVKEELIKLHQESNWNRENA